MSSWPRQREVIGKIRKVLHRVYGAEDAWVIQREGETRLEALVQGKRAVLYADREANFWAQFYREGLKVIWRGGEKRVVKFLRPKSEREIIDTLRSYWEHLMERHQEE
ncbi:MAG: hypothetical protein QN198_07295 [Armatimonadota bacterium]|nr:hypothetical protein [Armatimonadota bacterium]MDR5703394.1 hypothetical protein [Armatimonadota bacterium]MDR7434743.1 hypothetical protein [Armatimonadota bacterium]